VETFVNKQTKIIQDQQKQLQMKQVLQDQSDEERKALEDMLNAQMESIYLFKKNWKDYKGNVHALQAELRARKYLPWLYAVAAVLLFKRDTVQDNALVGLAGYGTGDLIEQTGYGIAHFGTRLVYSF
jgi:hypothetical protein